jgi:hypothetical protein
VALGSLQKEIEGAIEEYTLAIDCPTQRSPLKPEPSTIAVSSRQMELGGRNCGLVRCLACRTFLSINKCWRCSTAQTVWAHIEPEAAIDDYTAALALPESQKDKVLAVADGSPHENGDMSRWSRF